jgi:hypothetical protein
MAVAKVMKKDSDSQTHIIASTTQAMQRADAMRILQARYSCMLLPLLCVAGCRGHVAGSVLAMSGRTQSRSASILLRFALVKLYSRALLSFRFALRRSHVFTRFQNVGPLAHFAAPPARARRKKRHRGEFAKGCENGMSRCYKQPQIDTASEARKKEPKKCTTKKAAEE